MKTPLPQPDENARFRPGDFLKVFEAVSDDGVLIGGQAVAWWADYYRLPDADSVTSRDIDFWGDRSFVSALAEHLGVKPYWPHKYEMTVLSGAVAINVGNLNSSIEVLHSVPGLDHNDPETVSIPQHPGKCSRDIRVLTPVSLLIVKLHGLRHFDQTHRNDLEHVRLLIQACVPFLAEIASNPKAVIWNCNRILHASKLKPYLKLAATHGFRLLDAIPIDAIKEKSRDESHPGSKHFASFLENQWPRFLAEN